jgi:hypothetical protein
MDTGIIQTKNNDVQYAAGYCKQTFHTSGEPVVNSYKCNQKQFSASDMWSIQKHRRQIAIGQSINVM